MKFSHHIIIGQTLTDLQGKLDSILAAHPQQQVVFKRYFLPDESLRQQLPAEEGAVSYIVQPVLCEGSVALWLVLCEGAKVHDQGSETILEGEGIRLIITASLTCPEGTSEQQTRSIFSAYAAGLERHGLTLEGNCVRTWLFCDDIDHQYAGLVKARREFFAACGLTAQTHFIASTGIAGRPAGAIVQMDALAIEGAFTQRYLYARTHLSPTYDYGVTFERGVRIDAGGHHATLISGTASIDHKGNILHEGDVTAQTRRMWENVEALLDEAGDTWSDIRMMLVYLRNREDAALVKPLFDERFPDTPKVFLHAPVCRPGWLVEMECIASA
jgi:enamine deaminase RidA (YjgF/YER057c/UK114 family)